MRDHLASEVGFVSVTSKGHDESKFMVINSCNTSGSKELDKEVQDALVKKATEAVKELQKQVPDGVEVVVGFTLLPEHCEEVKCNL